MPVEAKAWRQVPVSWAVATFLGVGHFPIASGTVATAAAFPVFLAAYHLGGDPLVAGLALFFAVAGVAAAGSLESALGYHDPSEVVIDEVAGLFVTMLLLPVTLWTCVAGFFLFRLFDVLKPWPASRAERLPGGWGIMADDLVCGAMANILIRIGLALTETMPWK